jgi:lipoprotein-anchoring transpeptidase ErfK/SrfK
MALRQTIAGFRPGRRTWLLGGLVVALVGLLATAGITTMAWGDTLRDEERLLPGTTIATVDVGDTTLTEAVAAVEEHLGPRLERGVELVHGERSWQVSAQDLGADTDAADVVAAAFERTRDASLADLARMRWAGAAIGPELDAAMTVPDGAIEAFVSSVAEEVDRDPRDAGATWNGDAFEIATGRTGLAADVGATVDAVTEALDGDEDTVELVVDRFAPEITTDAVREAASALTPHVDAALDHTVTVAHDNETWSVSPRDLGATPDVAPALADVLDGGDPGDVELSLPDGAVSGFVASVASGIDVAPRDATLGWDGDEMDITPERDGLAVDRDEAATDLRRALAGGEERVELSVARARASVTTSSFDRVLVLRQRERMLYLYEGRESVDQWPVAVGQGGSPTPRGTFTVGAKRFEPTWNNPSPDGWGSDMPERIGPGPDNPLGVRALNWNQGGRDTLIRFHGTPNEDSIGEAASQGCVRMYNADVIELYDTIPSGTMIVSMN